MLLSLNLASVSSARPSLVLWPKEERPVPSYLFTTNRFPKTWPKARGPRRPTRDLLSEREQAR
jgi:hypothetical protein